MIRKVCSIKYYLMKDDSIGLQCDNYLQAIKRDEEGEKFYSFVLFGLLENGGIEPRDTRENLSAERAHELLEVIQSEFTEISEEEFEKAEAEYSRRVAELNKLWRSSDLFKKYYGIDVVTNEQKDIMERVRRFLKKTKENQL